jgi:hypothetical protein
VADGRERPTGACVLLKRQNPAMLLRRAVLVTAAVELFILGYLLGPDGSRGRPAMLRNGAVTVAYGPGWVPADPAHSPATPGLRRPAALTRTDGSALAVGSLGTTADATASLTPVFGERPPAAEPVRIGRVDALAYRRSGADGLTAAYVFALSGGERMAITCRSSSPRDPCSPVIASAQVEDATEPAPPPAVAARLGAAIAATSAADDDQRPELGAPGFGRRARAATALAHAHDSLAETASLLTGRLSDPVAVAAVRSVATAAAGVAAELGRLAAAARHHDRRAFAAARGRVLSQDAALRKAIGALGAAGFAQTVDGV